MRRWAALLSVLLMVLAGCATSSSVGELADEDAEYGSGIDLDFEGDPQRPGSGEGAEAPGGQQSGPAQPGSTHPSSSSEDEGEEAPRSSRRGPIDGGRPGQNAYHYLNAEVPRLVVEITAMQGLEPHDATIGLIRERLQQVADKPGGIDFVVNRVPREYRPQGWSMANIQDFERRNRQHSNSSEAAVLHMSFIGGQPSEGGAIGVAYSASSMVVFLERIRNAAATPLLAPEHIERSTTLHEVGHLLALVNLTYKSPRNHEDSANPGHSNNPNSVMYWAVEDVSIAGLLQGRSRPPTEFDADDLADLEDLKNGRLP